MIKLLPYGNIRAQESMLEELLYAMMKGTAMTTIGAAPPEVDNAEGTTTTPRAS